MLPSYRVSDTDIVSGTVTHHMPGMPEPSDTAGQKETVSGIVTHHDPEADQVHYATASRGQVPNRVPNPKVHYNFVSTTLPPQEKHSVPCLMGTPFPIPHLLLPNLPKFQ